MNIIYYLDEFYRYSESKKLFKLISVDGFIFKFECGHWCTDCVFIDLIRVSTGKGNWEPQQLELF